MEKNIAWLSILIFLVFVSCEATVVFKVPQPKGISEVSAFATEFQGTFLCDSDSSVVVVNDHCIYKINWFDFSISKKQIKADSNLVESGEFLYVKDIGKCAIYREKNDTVFASVAMADTLFLLGENENILKQYKGHHFLNLKLQRGNYEVVVLSLDEEKNLELKLATLPEEIEKLEAITPTKDISREDLEQYEINPTRLEFDEILKQEIVFETCEYFKRIRIPIQELYPF